MRYRVSLPWDGAVEARELLGLGRITKEPIELELGPEQVRSLRARGIVLESTEKAPPEPARED